MVIDAKGLACPKPVMLAEGETLSKIAEGIVEVLVDNKPSADNLAWFAKQNGLFSETIKEDGQWRVKIVKGYACQTTSSEFVVQISAYQKETEKSLLLIVDTDSFGKEEELGRMLVKGFFETMKVTREIPHSIFSLNAGVKLTTVNEEIIPVLKDLESLGAEIFSCGTCLKYYDLESALKVGYRGTTNHTIEGDDRLSEGDLDLIRG